MNWQMRVKNIVLILSFIVYVLQGFSQIPQAIEVMGCGPEDGIWERYSGTLGPDVAALNSVCGCYNKAGSTDVLYVKDTLTLYAIYVATSSSGTPGNGCGTAVVLDPIAHFVDSKNSKDCDFSEFTGFSTCSITETTISVSSIPTLGEWGLIILGLFLAIFGLVAVRQRHLV